MEVILRNGLETQEFFKKLITQIEIDLDELLRGAILRESDVVRARIKTADDHSWARASKWVRAKKATDQALVGTEEFIKTRTGRHSAKLFGATRDGEWTMTQHDRGFFNALESPKEKHDASGRVVLELRDPSALSRPLMMAKISRDKRVSIPSSYFAFKPERVGYTPPRKIWSTDKEVQGRVQPRALEWFKRVIAKAGGTLVT